MNLYPRSFLRLIMLAWVAMALPLLFAIAYASISLSQITDRSETAVQQAALTSRLGWELDESLVHMERALRQYEVLRDPSLLGDYEKKRQAWRTVCLQFAALPLLTPLQGRIKEMLAHEAAAQQHFASSGSDPGPLLVALEEASVQLNALLVEASRLTETERLAFRDEAESARLGLIVALVVALLLAGIMFWLGRRTVAKLLSRVERAVILLGNNLLERRIRFRGPEDLQRIGRHLDWLRRRLRTLELERKRILRHVSHELKTPLAALREGSSLLSEGVAGPLSPQQTRIASIMKGNTLRLQELIDGLLRLQQAEHARSQIQLTPIQLDALIQQALTTHQLAARDKHLRITGSLAPLTVEGGIEEVTTIVSNMISNAIKFSPEGATIRLSLTRNDDHAIFDVIDEGPGVPDDDRERIFEPFYRTAGSKSVAGIGLGLAIAREFALAQRGSLNLVASAAGAHFRTTLPLAGRPA